jgi:hypothetical protein
MGCDIIDGVAIKQQPGDVTPTAGFHPSADIRPTPDRQAPGTEIDRQNGSL